MVWSSNLITMVGKGKVLFVFEHRFELLSELGRVFVSVHCDGMMNCRQHDLFLFPAYPESAVVVTRMLPAVDNFSFTHRVIPPGMKLISYDFIMVDRALSI